MPCLATDDRESLSFVQSSQRQLQCPSLDLGVSIEVIDPFVSGLAQRCGSRSPDAVTDLGGSSDTSCCLGQCSPDEFAVGFASKHGQLAVEGSGDSCQPAGERRKLGRGPTAGGQLLDGKGGLTYRLVQFNLQVGNGPPRR